MVRHLMHADAMDDRQRRSSSRSPPGMPRADRRNADDNERNGRRGRGSGAEFEVAANGMSEIMSTSKEMQKQMKLQSAILEKLMTSPAPTVGTALLAPPGLPAPAAAGAASSSMAVDVPREVRLVAAVDRANAGAKPSGVHFAAVTAAAADFRKKLHQLHNTSNRIEKLEKNIKELKEFKTPNGVKPHALPYQSDFYDEVFLGSDMEAKVFSFSIGSDCSHAEAREQVYLTMQPTSTSST